MRGIWVLFGVLLTGGISGFSLSQESPPAEPLPPPARTALPIAPEPPEGGSPAEDPSAGKAQAPEPEPEPAPVTEQEETPEPAGAPEPEATPPPEPEEAPEPFTEEAPEPQATPSPAPSSALGAPPWPPPVPEEAPPSKTPPRRDKPHPGEFRELSLLLLPGYLKKESAPSRRGGDGFGLGVAVDFFLHRTVGIHFPYTYGRFASGVDTHAAGAGPVARFLDWKFLRGTVDAGLLYARALGGNRLGWSLGTQFSAGFKKAPSMPFFGPFFRYERYALAGPDLSFLHFGLLIALTNYADIH